MESGGAKTLGAYVLTTLIAVTLGLGLVNVIQPGNRLAPEAEEQLKASVDERLEQESDYQGDFEKNQDNALNYKDKGPLDPYVDLFFSENLFNSLSDNKLMLQVILFAVFFGICLSMIPEAQGNPVKAFVDGANEVVLKMIWVIMKAAPFFVFALMAGPISKLAGDDPSLMVEIFKGLLWYCVTVTLGLFILAFIFYPIVIKLFVGKISYKEFFNRIGLAQSIAFSSSSSAATLPVTMQCVNKNLGVSKKVTDFVLPIGATVNMDGTSLYQAIAVVFLAQFFDHDLTITQQLIIVLTSYTGIYRIAGSTQRRIGDVDHRSGVCWFTGSMDCLDLPG